MPHYRIRRFGWLPDPFDHRDLTPASSTVKGAFAATAKRSDARIKQTPPKTTPKKVDLSPNCPRVEDQGQIGSCTAQAVVGLLEYLWKQAYGRQVDASRMFLYKATRNLLGWTGDTGAFVRTAIKASKLFGACPEEYWPYEEDRFDEEPTAFCYSFAQNYRSLVYYRLREDVKSLKASLAQGIPFAFGFTCFESIDDDEVFETGEIPFPKKDEPSVGGHAIVAVGYDDDKRTFKFRNSWGRDWGKNGYGFLPYKYFDAGLADDCWCILKSDYDDLKQIT